MALDDLLFYEREVLETQLNLSPYTLAVNHALF